MESLFLDLKKIMEMQDKTLKDLLKAARDHNRALRKLDTSLLREAIAREEEIIAVMEAREEDRVKITDSIADMFNMDKIEDIRGFLEKAPRSIKGDLEKIVDTMRKSVRELVEINSTNEDLTKQAMKINEMMMRMLTQTGGNVYTPNGRRADEGRSVSLIDRKI